METNAPGISNQIVVWGVGTARTLRVHWALQELGLRYKTVPTLARSGETSALPYARMNPRKKIPFLQDGEFSMGESAAIIAYLAGKYGGASRHLIPTAEPQYAQWLSWCLAVIGELDGSALYVIRRHGPLGHIYGSDENAVLQAAAYFSRKIRLFEESLKDGRPYLMGDDLTTADILLATCLTWARNSGIRLPEVFDGYVARIEARPAYRLGLDANRMP